MTELEPEYCIHCHARIQKDWPVQGEWAHNHGGRYCRDRNGFTATPLNVATPTFHGDGDVL